MRALLIGAVESTRVALHAIADAPDWTLAGLVTLPLDLAARHSDFVDLEPEATAVGCPVIRAANSNAEDVRAEIAALSPDYIFVIGSSQLCGEALRAVTPERMVGYHPAPLPRLRGRGVIPWTILLDEPITAGTLFLIDEGTDSGAILGQHFFHVAPDETAATLYAKHMAVLSQMLPALLSGLASGTLTPRIQDERYATFAARRRPEDGEIDWRESAATIWRTVRACGDPYPGAWTMLGEERLVIAKAEPIDLSEHRAALVGQIVGRSAEGFTVRCGDGRGLRVKAWRWSKSAPPPIHARLGERR